MKELLFSAIASFALLLTLPVAPRSSSSSQPQQAKHDTRYWWTDAAERSKPASVEVRP